MTIKNKLTEEMRATRGGSHGKITSLANGFKLKNNLPFYIVIVPVASVTDVLIATPEAAGLLVNCTFHQEDNATDYPFAFLTESIPALREISPDAIELETYDVYWVCGEEAEPFYTEMVD